MQPLRMVGLLGMALVCLTQASCGCGGGDRGNTSTTIVLGDGDDGAPPVSPNPPPAGGTASTISLAVTVISSVEIRVSWAWEGNWPNPTEFALQRSMDDDLHWATILNLPATDGTHADIGLFAGRTYYYRIFRQGVLYFQTEPVQVPYYSRIAAGYYHSLWLDTNGNIHARGSNGSGQLASSYSNAGSSFIPVTAFESFAGLDYTMVQVAAGSEFSLALDSNGKAWGWGKGMSSSPQGVAAGIQLLSAGWNHYLMLKTGGKEILDCYVGGPTATLNLTEEIVALVAGNGHSLALGANGKVYAWGNNGNGQLGIGSYSPSSTPVMVSGTDFADFVAVAAGYEHSLALKKDGTVWAWGSSYGAPSMSASPQMVVGLQDVVAISASMSCSFAVCKDGSVWTWGSYPYYYPIDLMQGWPNPNPYKVTGLSGKNVFLISAGFYDVLTAIKTPTASELWGWGSNAKGQLNPEGSLGNWQPTQIWSF